MRYRKLLPGLAVVLLSLAQPGFAQTSRAAPPIATQPTKPITFDVVSVRPADPTLPQGSMFQFTDNGLHMTGLPLGVLIRLAYQAGFETKVQGLPGWTNTTQYDIEARVSDSEVPEYRKLVHDTTSVGQAFRSAVLRNMLAERFKLTAHHETSEGTIYTLVVAKGGPKLQKAEENQPPSMLAIPHGHLKVERAMIAAVAPYLAQELGHSVTDKTGLAGKYSFTLDWPPDRGTANSADSSNTGPSIFTAVEEQLGLKLQAAKGPVDTIVVDHIEKPSEN